MDTTETPDTTAQPKKNKKAIIIRIGIILAVLIAIAIYLFYYFTDAATYPSTDDAYVHAHILKIAPQVSGQVDHIYVQNMQRVNKNQLLYDIKPQDFATTLKSAEAQLLLAERHVKGSHKAVTVAQALVKERESNLRDVEGDTKRILELAAKGFASKQAALNATTNLATAKAQLSHAKTFLAQTIIKAGDKGALNAQAQQAEAAVASAKLNMSYTKIYAPSDGTIVNFKLRPNSWVTKGRSNFSLIEHSDWWVDANYKETVLNTIKIGMPATINIDMYPNHAFKGYVGNISRGSGAAFSLLPPENATGNWVKVTRRFPVRVFFLDKNFKHVLRVGSSATVTINTTKILKDHEQAHD